MPHGDPGAMHAWARSLRWEADRIEQIMADLAIPQAHEFSGRIADAFRANRDELRNSARLQRDRLLDLASWVDGRANDLQRQIDEARRRAQEAERRRQQILTWWPWRR